MRSFDGAEICELVELFIQGSLENILCKRNFGLYQDEGLILLRKLNGQSKQTKRRKAISKIFKDIAFGIDIQTNLKEVDFLDVTLNLQNVTYCPYKKPDDNLLYIHSYRTINHKSSNSYQISIFERLSNKSSNQEISNTAEAECEDALKKSGYNVDLKYTNNKSEKPKTRKRNMIWFNPNFSKFVLTNGAGTFL